MSYIRRLPSGKWQATVRGPDGRKHTQSDRLKSVVKLWATEQENRFAQGEIRDPRAGDLHVGDWYRRFAAASGVQSITAAKNRSLWATHCEPKWPSWRMSAITRMEAQGWVGELRETRLARHRGRAVRAAADTPFLSADTIHAAVHIMSSVYRAAMKEHPPIVLANPFAELGMDVGMRLGELAGLHGHRVDWLRGKITVVDVMTRLGLREWPKSKRSHRVVPVRPRTLEGMSVLMTDRQRGAVVFTDSKGGPVSDRNFANRVWFPAIEAARLCGNPAPGPRDEYRPGECGPRFCDDPGHRIRRFPPRIMRHTAASWLVQDGVPL